VKLIHLIDRIYLCSDAALDTNEDRVVISKDNGYQMHEVIEKLSAGLLIKFGTTVDEVIDKTPILFFETLLKISKSRQRSIYIYADRSALPTIMGIWFKILFKAPNILICKKIYNTNIHRYNLLYKSYLSKRTTNFSLKSNFEHMKLEEGLSKNYSIGESIRKSFILKHIDSLNVEILLYMFLAKGKFKEQLKTSIKRLYRKHIDQIMIEYKMYFLIYSSNKSFCDRLGLNSTLCDFDNELHLDETNRFIEFFTSKRLYKKDEITKASAFDSDFRFEKMTDYDVETLYLYKEAIGSYYNSDQSNNFIADDSYILSFIKALSDEFTDDLLEQMIKTEAEFDNPSGVFYNIKMETVNNLLCQKILRAYKENTLQDLDGLSII
jgi:hypothetical protein